MNWLAERSAVIEVDGKQFNVSIAFQTLRKGREGAQLLHQEFQERWKISVPMQGTIVKVDVQMVMKSLRTSSYGA